MTKEKLLVLGMGSPNDAKIYENARIGTESVVDYAKSQGVKVYQNPDDGKLLRTSIHRATDDTMEYANEIQHLAEDHAVATILTGGLALAMPGVVAAKACNALVIGVPTDLDAFYNTHKIPDGTALAEVGVNNVEAAVKYACAALNMENNMQVNYLVLGHCPSAKNTVNMLKRFVPEAKEVSEGDEKYDGLTLLIADQVFAIRDYDARINHANGMGIFAPEKVNSTDVVAGVMQDTKMQSVAVGRPINAGLLAARIVGMYNANVQDELRQFRVEEARKYPVRKKMMLEDFVGRVE